MATSFFDFHKRIASSSVSLIQLERDPAKLLSWDPVVGFSSSDCPLGARRNWATILESSWYALLSTSVLQCKFVSCKSCQHLLRPIHHSAGMSSRQLRFQGSDRQTQTIRNAQEGVASSRFQGTTSFLASYCRMRGTAKPPRMSFPAIHLLPVLRRRRSCGCASRVCLRPLRRRASHTLGAARCVGPSL